MREDMLQGVCMHVCMYVSLCVCLDDAWLTLARVGHLQAKRSSSPNIMKETSLTHKKWEGYVHQRIHAHAHAHILEHACSQ